MKGILTTFCILLTLCSFAQEQVHIPFPQDADAPRSVRESSLYGKSIVMFGDSYIQNGGKPIEESWHYKLAAKYGMDYYNYGLNGNCIAYDRTSEKCGFPMYERYLDLPDGVDYVIVCAGHNDATQMARLGEGTDFFREKLASLCESLIRKYPGAKLCFVTPWKVPGPKFPEMTAVLLEVCASYSIPVFDATRYSNIFVWDEGFRRIYFQSPFDTAHLNAAGHDRFLPTMEHFLLGL